MSLHSATVCTSEINEFKGIRMNRDDHVWSQLTAHEEKECEWSEIFFSGLFLVLEKCCCLDEGQWSATPVESQTGEVNRKDSAKYVSYGSVNFLGWWRKLNMLFKALLMIVRYRLWWTSTAASTVENQVVQLPFCIWKLLTDVKHVVCKL